MTTYAVIVTLIALGEGAALWIQHRGIAGIKSDLADAKAVADKAKAQV